MLHKKHPETAALAGELAALPVFASLSARSVEALAGCGRVVHLPADWAILSEAQPGDCCYVLLEGNAEVRQHGEQVAVLGPGALVGEAALVEHRTRNASVISVTPLRALRLGFEDISVLFAKHPDVEQAFRGEWQKRATPA